MPAQICFRNHVGLPGQPGAPTVDGFIEPEEFLETGFGTTPSQVDTGWTGAARITYVADTSVGAGRPLAVLQCLKESGADFIHLAFIVRRDTQFHDNDCIVLVLRPTFPAAGAVQDGSERRIDIFPNSTGVGAGVADGMGTTLRENRDPRNVEHYRWDTASARWVSTAAANNVTIKARSWDLGTNNKNWSVEVRLPTTVAQGGAGWIDLNASFGFYANLIRLCDGDECSFDPTPFDGGAFQFTFPRANYATGDGLIQDVNALDEAEIPLAWLGEAFLGNVAGCSGVVGVKFQNGASSIGVLSGGSISSSISGTNPNTFVARVVNTASTTAQAVQASLRIANWGIGPGDNNKWNLVPATGGTSNPTGGTNIPAGGAATDLTMQWQLSAAEQALYGTPPGKPLSRHQCIWVLLDSVNAVDFVESSVRRNCDFVGLSEEERTAEISGDGYPPPPAGETDHEMVLIVSQMRRGRLVRNDPKPDVVARNTSRLANNSAYREGSVYQESTGFAQILDMLRALLGGFTVVYDWVWVMDGYRRTAYDLSLNAKTYRIFEPVGAFGYIADHEGLVANWSQSVTADTSSADRFEVAGPDAYRVRVPDGGKVHIITRLQAQEAVIPWWFWLLLLLVLIIIIYLLTLLF